MYRPLELCMERDPGMGWAMGRVFSGSVVGGIFRQFDLISMASGRNYFGL